MSGLGVLDKTQTTNPKGCDKEYLYTPRVSLNTQNAKVVQFCLARKERKTLGYAIHYYVPDLPHQVRQLQLYL